MKVLLSTIVMQGAPPLALLPYSVGNQQTLELWFQFQAHIIVLVIVDVICKWSIAEINNNGSRRTMCHRIHLHRHTHINTDAHLCTWFYVYPYKYCWCVCVHVCDALSDICIAVDATVRMLRYTVTLHTHTYTYTHTHICIETLALFNITSLISP